MCLKRKSHKGFLEHFKYKAHGSAKLIPKTRVMIECSLCAQSYTKSVVLLSKIIQSACNFKVILINRYLKRLCTLIYLHLNIMHSSSAREGCQ